MATLIRRLDHFAPESRLYQLADGRHVIVTVPHTVQPLPREVWQDLGVQSLTDLASQTREVISPTEVYLADEHGVPVDADGDPTNGLTALAQFETGTTFEQALAAIEEDS